MSPCEDFDSRLLLYLDNALNPQEAEHMRAHLQTCANCRARREEERELSRLLKRSRPLYSAPQQLRARVSAIERESASTPTRTARRNWWHGGPWTSNWKVLVHSNARDRTCSSSRRRAEGARLQLCGARPPACRCRGPLHEGKAVRLAHVGSP